MMDTRSTMPCPFPAQPSFDPEAFDPFDETYLNDPYPSLKAARRATSVFHASSIDHWVVTRYADLRQIFRTPALFSAVNANSPLVPPCPAAMQELEAGGYRPVPTLANVDPPAHTRYRRLANVGFTPKRVAAMEPFIRELVRRFLDERFTGKNADLVRDLAWELPALVLFRILGIPDADVPVVKAGGEHRLALVYGRASPERQVEAARGMAGFFRYATGLIEARLANPSNDFTSDLAHATDQDGARLTVPEAATIMLAFVFAGHETTTGLLGNAFRRLLEDRPSWNAICADPTLLPNAVEEVLRLDSSVIAWRRRTMQTVEIGGVAVPAQANLLLMIGAANRDPAHFVNPDFLDIRRSNARDHLAFGQNVHLCLGAPLARLQARVVLEEVSQRLPTLRLIPTDLRFMPNISFRGPLSLPAQWK
jgi:cytochrome P450